MKPLGESLNNCKGTVLTRIKQVTNYLIRKNLLSFDTQQVVCTDSLNSISRILSSVLNDDLNESKKLNALGVRQQRSFAIKSGFNGLLV
jgi:hypothetical protein